MVFSGFAAVRESDRAATIGDYFVNGASHGFLIGADDFVNPGTGIVKVQSVVFLPHCVFQPFGIFTRYAKKLTLVKLF